MKRHLLIELNPNRLTPISIDDIDEALKDIGCTLDRNYPPSTTPGERLSGDTTPPFVRCDFEAGDDATIIRQLNAFEWIQALHSDPHIITTSIGARPPLQRYSLPKGSYRTVQSVIQASTLQQEDMTGKHVYLALIDNGVSLAHLKKHPAGPNISCNEDYSLTYFGKKPGGNPKKEHATQMAFDAWLGAPQYTLLDYPVVESIDNQPVQRLLSDVCIAYAYLLRFITRESKPRLVINNSWAIFDAKQECVPHTGTYNYCVDPEHIVNQLIGTLEAAGADIVFAAGNCGKGGSDYCSSKGQNTIWGANAHPAVLTVGAVTAYHEGLDFSSQGPGTLKKEKPDVSSFSLFTEKADSPYPKYSHGGTSTACAVMSGVIAAIRTQYDPQDLPPKKLRELIRQTANGLGQSGYDSSYGFGVLDVANLLKHLPDPSLRKPAQPVA